MYILLLTFSLLNYFLHLITPLKEIPEREFITAIDGYGGVRWNLDTIQKVIQEKNISIHTTSFLDYMDHRYHPRTFIEFAIALKQWHVADWALDANVDVHALTTKEGKTVLHEIACHFDHYSEKTQNEQIALFKNVIAKGIDINALCTQELTTIQRKPTVFDSFMELRFDRLDDDYFKNFIHAFMDNGLKLVKANGDSVLNELLNEGYEPVWRKRAHKTSKILLYSMMHPIKKQYTLSYMLFNKIKMKQTKEKLPLLPKRVQTYIADMATKELFDTKLQEMSTILMNQKPKDRWGREGLTVYARWKRRESPYRDTILIEQEARLFDPQAWEHDIIEWRQYKDKSSARNMILQAFKPSDIL